MTIKDVAQLLRVSPACVYELVGAGKLACYRIGKGRGTIRISDAQLEAFLRSNENGGEPVAVTAPRRVAFKHLS